MTSAFNPYHQWLDFPAEKTQLDYFELLGVSRYELSISAIIQAGDKAMAKVRSQRPGEHAQHWATLLDELAEANRVLTDEDDCSTENLALYDVQTDENPH